MLIDNRIRLCGRYFKDNQTFGFDNVASGIEFCFIGTSIHILTKTFARERINKDFPMFSVINVRIDGADYKTINIKNDEYTKVLIADKLENTRHNVEILKTDDPLISTFYIKEVFVDGELINPIKRDLNIEAYGDSILSGGDNLIGDGPSLDVVPGTGDGTKTYVTLAADRLNANVSIFSRCGLCLYPASSSDKEIVVSKIYDKVSTQHLEDWDMTNYVPNIIVIGLGTNDELGDLFNKVDFINEYKKFIIELSKAYSKNILFICSYGYMNKNDLVKESIKEVVSSLKKDNYLIEELELPKAKRGHPSVEEHTIGSFLLEEVIKKYY